MRHVFLLVWLLGGYVVDARGQFILSWSGEGHPGLTEAESARIIKIAVTPNGDAITVNGSRTTLKGLDSALHEFAKQKREIWYHRKLGTATRFTKEPLTTAIMVAANAKIDPAGTKILEVAVEYHLPVRFSDNLDFSEGNVREVHTVKDLTLASPPPEYPLSARTHGIGGGGVFRQHIDAQTGVVTSVTTKQSTGHALLDRCAASALRQWKYKTPIKFETVAVPITFAPDKSHLTQ